MIRLACADTNEEYLKRLTAVLEETPDFRISVFSDAEILCDAVSEGRFDVLLLDPSMDSAQLNSENIPVTVLLVGDTDVPYALKDMLMIQKYQRISRIRQRLLEICSDKLGNHTGFAVGGRASVFSFYSPIGGSGKTTAALICAARLAMTGKRTFYLNLETFAGDESYLPQEQTENGLSSLLMRLSGKGDSVMYMKSCLLNKAENFSYMKHFDSPNDYAAMNTEDLEGVIQLFQSSGCFDCIVIDMDSALDEKTKKVFSMSDRIVLVEKDDAVGLLKMKLFLSQRHLVNEYGNKMVRVLNFAFGSQQGVSSEIPVVGRITAVGGMNAEQLISAKACGTEASFTEELARR